MIRKCTPKDRETIYEIVNDAAQAYNGKIPPDRWHDPYMPMEELEHEIAAGVAFYGYADGGRLIGVMGMQNVKDVTLIRHAYVRTSERNKGIGGKLLAHLLTLADRPLLVGTWTDAAWAIAFYEKHGFHRVTEEEKDLLLKKYWDIPGRQVETSTVLADDKWRTSSRKPLIRQ